MHEVAHGELDGLVVAGAVDPLLKVDDIQLAADQGEAGEVLIGVEVVHTGAQDVGELLEHVVAVWEVPGDAKGTAHVEQHAAEGTGAVLGGPEELEGVVEGAGDGCLALWVGVARREWEMRREARQPAKQHVLVMSFLLATYVVT